MIDYQQPGIQHESPVVIVEPRTGFWGWWLNLTAPPRNEQTTAGSVKREELRKAELTGYFLFVLIFFCLFDFIMGIMHPVSLLVVLVFALFLCAIGYLNRSGRTQLASGLLIGSIILSLSFVVFVVLSNKGGADLFPSYDLFVYPIVIGGLFLPRKFIFPFAIFAAAIVILNLLYGPHSADVETLKRTEGLFVIAIRPTVLIMVIAFVSWLGMRSVERAILRADHAEELVAAEKQISAQSHLIAEQNARLQAGIVQILSVHKEAAAGNYSVRAPVHSDDAIWQIGRSLNNLLARYERLAHDSQELAQTKSDIEAIATAIEMSRHGQKGDYPRCNSIAGKRILAAMGVPVVDAESARQFPGVNKPPVYKSGGETPGQRQPVSDQRHVPEQRAAVSEQLNTPVQRPPTSDRLNTPIKNPSSEPSHRMLRRFPFRPPQQGEDGGKNL